MSDSNEWDWGSIFILAAAALGGAVAAYAASAAPALAWSLLHGRFSLLDPGEGIGRTIGWASSAQSPPTVFSVVIDSVIGALVAAASLMVLLRVDRWRAADVVARSSWDPRSLVKPRPFAKPRDLLHLTARPETLLDHLREPLVGALRFLLNDRRRPADAGGDGWRLGRLGRKVGRPVRSQGEMGMLVVAATRGGKTSRLITPALVELDESAAVVMSNKADVLVDSLAARRDRGPVWVFAPMATPGTLPVPTAGWSPLSECQTWEGALRMAGWILDADPGASASSQDSGGARFYNREATAVLLPACLHAAALEDGSMTTVLAWLRSGLIGLDQPREILHRQGATSAADALAGVQRMEERPLSLLLMSAAQLLDVYRFPSVQASDHADFRPEDLLAGGTLYILAPQSQQESLAPLFGGLLSSVLRVWEENAASTGRSSQRLHVFVDEAANLAPLASLPTYLAVSTGWGVRWCLAYQTVGQIEHRYGRETDAVLGNLLVKAFMGPVHDQATSDYVAGLMGEQTVTSRSWNSTSFTASGSKTEHERQAPKVSRQALSQLAEGEALIVHGRDLPFRTYLAQVPRGTRGFRR